MYAAHRKTCPCRPREVLVQQLAAQEEAHAAVQRRADDLAARVRQLEEANKVGARVCGGDGGGVHSRRRAAFSLPAHLLHFLCALVAAAQP